MDGNTSSSVMVIVQVCDPEIFGFEISESECDGAIAALNKMGSRTKAGSMGSAWREDGADEGQDYDH
jgi:hypothetical protein